ncbi:hypothetical protein PSUB009319_24410 [Ralstonia sp. SET104]|nr:hypothetical protein PSUB009319_24410 [Ralstonia sp. SET104]
MHPLPCCGVTLHSFYEVQRSSIELIELIEPIEPEVSRTLVLVTRKAAQ